MNIARVNIDALNARLTVKVEKPDYESQVEHTLRDYRRKAQIPGFRPGMVPMGVVKKMYQKAVTADEVLKQVAAGIAKYIEDNRLSTLGKPLPSEDLQSTEFDAQSEFEFTFDIALAPKVQLKISKSIKIPYYTAAITDDMVQQRINKYRSYYGKMASSTKIEENSLVRVDLAQNKENGHTVQAALLSIKQIPDAEQQALLLGLAAGETVEVNVRKMLTNDADCAGFLNVAKEKLATIDPVFTLTITEIKHIEPAELDQYFFDNICGKDVINSAEAFAEKVKEDLRKAIAERSESRFAVDVRSTLLNLATLELPEPFLKRWLLEREDNKETTKEEVEKIFPTFAEDLRWQLIENFILSEENIDVKEEDMLLAAKKTVLRRLAIYGINNMSEDRLTEFAHTLLNRPEDHKNILVCAIEHLVIEYMRNTVTVERKEVTIEELNSLDATPSPELLNLE